MTYPPSSPGYPPAPQSGPQYGATQQFARPADVTPGESNLPQILLAVVAAAGLISYLVSYGPLLNSTQGLTGTGWGVDASLIAGLLAGASLLPKQKNWTAISAVISIYAFLTVLFVVIVGSSAIEWGYYVILALTVIQAGCSVTALLFDAGVVAPPAPKPAYEQPQYGQYGGPSQYYGQHNQPQPGGQPYQQAPLQRPGYPTQYGGPSTSGFGMQGTQGGQQSGPPTPPTGFPTYGQPQHQSNASAPTTQVPAQQPSSQQSDQSSS